MQLPSQSRRAFLCAALAAGVLAPAAGHAAPAVRAALALPGSPYMVHSVVRYRGWRGPCVNVRNVQTGATKDIGFKDGLLNREALRAFLGDALGEVVTWYDQTGNGRHLTQATAANRPMISADHHVKGVVPISVDGAPDGTLIKTRKSLGVTGLSLSSRAVTCLQWVMQPNGINRGSPFALMVGPTTMGLELLTGASLSAPTSVGFFTFDGTTVNGASTLLPKSEGCMIGITSGASAIKPWVDGASATHNLAANQTITQQLLGWDSSADNYYLGDVFCNVVYASELTATDVAKVRAEMAAAFSQGPVGAAQLVIHSNSQWTGHAQTGCNTLLWYLQKYLPRPVSIANRSIWGTTAALEYTNRVAILGSAFDTNFPIRVYYYEQGVNDITGGATAAATYTKAKDTIAYAKSVGATHAIFGLCPATGGQYDVYNGLIQAGVGVDFDSIGNTYLGEARSFTLSDGHIASDGQIFGAQNVVTAIAKACGF